MSSFLYGFAVVFGALSLPLYADIITVGVSSITTSTSVSTSNGCAASDPYSVAVNCPTANSSPSNAGASVLNGSLGVGSGATLYGNSMPDPGLNGASAGGLVMFTETITVAGETGSEYVPIYLPFTQTVDPNSATADTNLYFGTGAYQDVDFSFSGVVTTYVYANSPFTFRYTLDATTSTGQLNSSGHTGMSLIFGTPYTSDGNTLLGSVFTPTPEPGTAVLLSCGLAALVCYRRSRSGSR